MNTVAAARLPELTLSRFLTEWQPDPVALVCVLLAGVLYAAGVLRLRRRGERWPAARTAGFVLLGLGTVVLATMSALMVYSRVLFWPAAVQNILLDLLAPLGLALGDPLALAGKALSPRGARRVERAATGPVARVLTFPFVSTVLVLASEMSIYFTHYFQTALGHYGVRQLMHLQLLGTGLLFVLPMLTGQEMLPRWCTHPVRALLVFVDGLFDSVPGIVVLFSGTLVAGPWYAAHPRDWGPSLHRDQQIGGGLMLTIAELVGLPFLAAVFAQWWRSERVRTRELDARLDRELTPVTGPVPAAGRDTGRDAAAPAPTAPAAPDGTGRAAAPERVRPWWETEGGEVGERMRRNVRR